MAIKGSLKEASLPDVLQLDSAIAAQTAHSDKRLGELLVAQGAITRDALHEQIKLQIDEAVYFLFTWKEGTFNFEADVAPEEQDFLVSINPESLLLEGARRVDEWSLIEKKIPSFDLVFEVDRNRLQESAAELTAEQETLVRLI